MLAALNSGRRDSLEEYASTYAPAGSQDLDGLMQSANQLRQLSVVEVIASEELELQFVLESSAFPLRLVGMLGVESAEAPRTTFSLPWTPVPAGSTVLGFGIDDAMRQRVIEGVAERIGSYYVLADEASRMEAAIRESLAAGAYDDIDNGWILANTLTQQLRAINNDLHLLVSFSPIADGPPTPGPFTMRQLPFGECGFGDVEQPQPGVGYVKVFAFTDPGPCRQRAEAILRGLTGFRAVIFDLIDNLGGNWGMSGLILSHLLESADQISAIHWREPERIQNLILSDPIEGVDFSGVEIYVLTSSRTFSAGESFAYDSQAARRAAIVGEVTRGGAHAARAERIDERFGMNLPYARAVNPITQSNWEGSGVQPDIVVPEGEALATVLRRAGARAE